LGLRGNRGRVGKHTTRLRLRLRLPKHCEHRQTPPSFFAAAASSHANNHHPLLHGLLQTIHLALKHSLNYNPSHHLAPLAWRPQWQQQRHSSTTSHTPSSTLTVFSGNTATIVAGNATTSTHIMISHVYSTLLYMSAISNSTMKDSPYLVAMALGLIAI
jgi:hypothetical protein